jgi:hypothetical protein
MVTVAKLAADLILNTAQFTAGADLASTKTKLMRSKIERELGEMGKSFNSLTSRILGIEGAIGGLIASGGLTLLASKALTAADQVAKLADRIGLTTTQVQEYAYAAHLSGISTEEMETAFGFLNRAIAEGKLPYKDINSALLDLAERTKAASSGIDRARIASEAFGSRAGAKLIPFLMQGASGLAAFKEEAHRLGIVLNEETIRGAENFKDQLEILGTVITNNFQQGLLSGFVGDSKEIRDIYSDPEFSSGIKSIGTAFGELAHGLIVSANAVSQAKTAIAELSINVRSRFNKTSPFYVGPEVADEALNKRPPTVPPLALPDKSSRGGPVGSAGDEVKAAKERATALSNVNDQLTKESAILQTQIVNYGLKDNAMKAAIRAKTTELELGAKGVTLSQKEHDALQMKLDLLRQQGEELDKLDALAKEAEESDKRRKQAIEELGLTFKSAFEDAVVGGGKLRDVLKGIADDIFRLFLRTQVTEPAFKSIMGGVSGGAGGLLGGLFDSQGLGSRIFQGGSGSFVGPLPSFASGTDYVQRDMVAKIHQGEAIMPAADAAAWRSGKGGATYYIDASGADRGAITELKAMLMNLAGPGRVEERVREGQRRGQL